MRKTGLCLAVLVCLTLLNQFLPQLRAKMSVFSPQDMIGMSDYIVVGEIKKDVTTKKRNAEYTVTYKEVTISIEDHGMGIPHAELKQIFQPFYRSPEASAAQIHGTGLGLPLAKHLAEAMGGTLSVSSRPGLGSIFSLHLKLAQPENQNLSTAGSHAVSR